MNYENRMVRYYPNRLLMEALDKAYPGDIVDPSKYRMLYVDIEINVPENPDFITYRLSRSGEIVDTDDSLNDKSYLKAFKKSGQSITLRGLYMKFELKTS